ESRPYSRSDSRRGTSASAPIQRSQLPLGADQAPRPQIGYCLLLQRPALGLSQASRRRGGGLSMRFGRRAVQLQPPPRTAARIPDEQRSVVELAALDPLDPSASVVSTYRNGCDGQMCV